MTAARRYWSSLPLGTEVELLVHDANGLAAFSKPAGILSHPNTPADEPRALLTTRYELGGEFYEWRDAAGELQRLWLLNRLDSATSGVILGAASEELATEIRAQFKRKQVRKIYHALVFGTPRASSEIWRDLLAVEKRGGRIRTDAAAGNVPAESQMRLLRKRGVGAGAMALIQLEPRTGRSHQLRVQCAKRHLPIVGDQTYGDFSRNREFAKRAATKRLFLHSQGSSFQYEFRGKTFSFSAQTPAPPEFEKFL